LNLKDLGSPIITKWGLPQACKAGLAFDTLLIRFTIPTNMKSHRLSSIDFKSIRSPEK
jgi:hypothetical protein